jgi:hypothetical protein
VDGWVDKKEKVFVKSFKKPVDENWMGGFISRKKVLVKH